MDESPEAVHVRFQEAFNRHDLEGIVALYEPGAVLITGGGTAAGIEAIREAYRGFLKLRPTIELKTLGVHRAGDLAMLHGKWQLTGTDSDGSTLHTAGRNTETVRRQPDGRWLFAIDNPLTP